MLLFLRGPPSQVLRRDSVLDIFMTIRSASDYRGEATRRIVGAIVMTPYNNRTYRVDDIDWDRTPRSTFKQDGQDKSFIQYFQVCGLGLPGGRVD